jgi:hypothetical protein
MSTIRDIIVDNFPPVSGLSIPLGTTVSITFNRMMLTTSGLSDTFFLEGPDTDQFVGPGLIEVQQYPDNISQGELSDFLMSPGYRGIVDGTFSYLTVSGGSIPTSGTQLIFTPSKPLAPSTSYTAHQGETYDASGVLISGYVTWSFETGTGSIIALPNTISTSVLAQAFRAPGMAPSASNPLSVISTTPKSHSVEQDISLTEIDIEFDKNLDATSISSDMISIVSFPATEHPNANVKATGELVFNYEVSGNMLKLKI